MTLPWMVLARSKLGMSETTDNAELSAFLASDGLTNGDPALNVWCGDFVQTCLALTLPDETFPADPFFAPNWTTWAREIDANGVIPYGSVMVITRKEVFGHVFFVTGQDADYFYGLGGNQFNKVCYAKFAKSRLLAIRWPATFPVGAGPINQVVA